MGVEFIATALLSGVVGAVVGSVTAAVAARRAGARVATARAELVSAATDARLERIDTSSPRQTKRGTGPTSGSEAKPTPTRPGRRTQHRLHLRERLSSRSPCDPCRRFAYARDALAAELPTYESLAHFQREYGKLTQA